MSELSDYETVAPEELGEPAAVNGANGAHPHEGAAPLGVGAPAAAASGLADTWGSNLPALRLSPVGSATTAAEENVKPAPSPAPTYDPLAAPPAALRVLRFLAGILLLGLAGAAAVALVVLVQLLLGGFPQATELAPRLGLYTVTALAAGWVAVVGLACLAAAAFSFTLAVTARGW